MLKRLLTVGALACTMLFAGNAKAQNENAPEYPRYGFWSNWSIGFDLMYSHQFDDQIDYRAWNLTHGSNLGGELMVEKELSPVWTYRFLVAGVPGVFGHNANSDKSLDLTMFGHDMDTCGLGNNGYDRYVSVMPIVLKLSINNWIKGYNPERRCNLYVLGGAGFGIERDRLHMGHIGLNDQIGLGWSRKMGPKMGSTFFVEFVAEDYCDVPNVFKGNAHMVTVEGKLGWLFSLGVTAADKEAIAQKNRLTDDYVRGLENQISALEQDLANSKQAEQRLQNRVNQLENENANLRNQLANAGKNTVKGDDSEAMRKIKENQSNLYGMPFSIQYAKNQYQVPGKEREKLEAVAEIMKSDNSVKYVIAGFCDQTGSDEYNQELSEKRANTVKDELVNKYGVNEDQLTVKGYGKSKPFGDAKYSINRRVSFYVNMD